MPRVPKLLIIDSNALLHRAFHALPPLISKNGEPTGAVYGFLLTLFRAIKDLGPNYMVACFDTPVPTFRHKQFKEYKATRPPTPVEIKSQISTTKEVLEAFDIPVFIKEGFEADDLIATIATLAGNQNKDIKIYILTGDLDTLQLVSDRVNIYTLGRGIKDTVIYDREKVIERLEITPEQVVDFKSLTGDPSDNIPGVHGIGKKTAADLLNKFGTLEKIYSVIDDKNVNIKERTRGLLSEDRKKAFTAKSLVQVKKDVDVDFNLKNCQFDFKDQKAEQILRKLDFNSLISKFPSLRNVVIKENSRLF